MPPPDERLNRVGPVVLGVGVVAFVVLAAVLVPWHPYPGGPLSPVDEHRLFTDAQIARAEHYSTWARLWSRLGLALTLAAAAWFGFGRTGRRLVGRLPGPWWVKAAEAALAVRVVLWSVGLPTSVAGQQLRRQVGLSTEGWGRFAADQALGLIIGAVITLVGVVVLVAVARRWRRAWPAVAGGLAAVVVVAASFVYPVVVEPAFNHFTPLPDGTLRDQILALAAQEHVHVDDVLVADASTRTTSLNAYVSGFGDTRRIVLYDTTLRSLPDDEIESVVAHELAHAHHDDVLHGTLIGAAGALVGVGLLSLLLDLLRRRGYPGAHEAAAVPLVLALVSLGSSLALPIENGLSRHIETRADVDALRTTRDAPAFVDLQRALAVRSLADPTPPAWSQWWFGSHPTALERAALPQRVLDVDGLPR